MGRGEPVLIFIYVLFSAVILKSSDADLSDKLLFITSFEDIEQSERVHILGSSEGVNSPEDGWGSRQSLKCFRGVANLIEKRVQFVRL